MNDFVIPKEEKWIKQVKVGGPSTINAFFKTAAYDPAIRGETIVGMLKDQIVVTYEENVNAEETTNE